MLVSKQPSSRRPSLLHFIKLTIFLPQSIGECQMRNLTLPSRAQRKLSKLHLEELSPEAKRRLKWFDWHRDHGQNVSLTCRHFGIARETFYRWKRRYKPFDLSSLEDRSSRPQRVRQRTWTTAEVVAVQRLREAFSRWGKEKLAVLLLREG